ncbi:MAG: hypothetical protein ABSD97_12915 [Acidimicrobiales bacterium]
MTRSRSLVIIAAMLGVLAIPGAGVHAATSPRTAIGSDSWKSAASGVWGLAANWTNGIPTSTDNVYITVPGTYTVTLAPWSIGTADPNQSGATVNSLTLGEASGTGTQTLLIAGQGSRSNSNEQVNTVSLDVAAASTISAHGNLVLDSTNGGLTLPGNPSGGYAGVFGATILNRGSIETETQAPKNKYANFTQFEAPLTNETRASVHDESGLLEATSVTNDGSFIVAPDASLSVVALQGVYAQPASFTNDGQLVNDGAITAAQGAGTVTWTQAGGPIKGNEIVLQNGTTLVDKSGAAQFLINWIAAKISGTIPAGQKITVVGEAYNSNGNNYNGTTLGLVGTVVNDGTIVLDAQGSGKNSGGPAIVTGGSIRNNGTIMAEVQDPSWTVQYQAGLQNTHAGALGITGGTFNDDGAFPATNDGTVEIGPRALYLLQEGASFANKGDGTIVTQVASAKSFGQFQMVSPCCAGSGRFTAGGSLIPRLVGRYVPAANTEFQLFLLSGGAFTGAFGRLAKSFTADYANESASPAFVGAIYDKSSKKPKADSLTSRAAVLGGRTGAF